jgi:hypothetical protein
MGDLYEELLEMLRDDPNPPYGLTPKHLDRAEDCSESDGVLSFRIERHPSVLGARTRGRPSAIFLSEHTLYRYDGKELESKLIKSTLKYDVHLAASELYGSIDDIPGTFEEVFDGSGSPTMEGVAKGVDPFHEYLLEKFSMAGCPDEFPSFWQEFRPVMLEYSLKRVTKIWEQQREDE